MTKTTQELTGKNIPHLPIDLINGESKKRSANSQKAFLQPEKKKRSHPQLDDKILTDWNGLMISAFARCAKMPQ